MNKQILRKKLAIDLIHQVLYFFYIYRIIFTTFFYLKINSETLDHQHIIWLKFCSGQIKLVNKGSRVEQSLLNNTNKKITTTLFNKIDFKY